MLVRSGVAIWGLAFTLTILGLAASGETRNSLPAGWSFTLPAGDPVAGGFAFAKLGCPKIEGGSRADLPGAATGRGCGAGTIHPRAGGTGPEPSVPSGASVHAP